jgi:hypothetical protein
MQTANSNIMLTPHKKLHIEKITRQWVEKAIIGLNLCPFAKAPYQRKEIRFKIGDAKNPQGFMDLFVAELAHLQANPKTETTLLIVPALGVAEHFHAYLQACEEILHEKQMLSDFQIVSFHPFARFDGLPVDSPKNLLAIAPYPIVHILRVASVEKLGASLKKDVQDENDRRLTAMTQDEFERFWKTIMK